MVEPDDVPEILLVAIDENDNYFATEDSVCIDEIGTVCDVSDMNLVSLDAPEERYKML